MFTDFQKEEDIGKFGNDSNHPDLRAPDTNLAHFSSLRAAEVKLTLSLTTASTRAGIRHAALQLLSRALTASVARQQLDNGVQELQVRHTSTWARNRRRGPEGDTARTVTTGGTVLYSSLRTSPSDKVKKRDRRRAEK